VFYSFVFGSACSVVLGSIHIVVLGSADRNMPMQSQSIPSQFGMAAKFINIFIHIVILGNDGSNDGVGN